MIKYIGQLYEMDCQIFRKINSNFNRKYLNRFFSTITHLGGAILSISTVLFLIYFTEGLLRMVSVASALSLTFSHLPVAFVKKVFPRQRPYLVLDQIFVTRSPLKDHSFPSGHTTAIFSIITPFICFIPSLAAILIPLGLAVGLSRIFLGLHYPSDVFVGALLGSVTGIITFSVISNKFIMFFI